MTPDEYKAKYGGGSIRLAGRDHALEVPRLSTGSAILDRALGGGLPLERPVLLWGLEASFKTTLLLKLAAQAQARQLTVGLIEPDGRFDPAYARSLGVQAEALLLTQPETGEQAIDAVSAMTDACDLVLFDSLAQLTPTPEQAPRTEHAARVLHETLVGRCVRAAVRKSVVFTNRSRIVGDGLAGSYELEPGGFLQSAACSVVMKIMAGEWIVEKDRPAQVGLEVQIRKNLTYAPRTAILSLYMLPDGRHPIGTFVEEVS